MVTRTLGRLPGPRAASTSRKRHAIVEAATALFLQHGYPGTSMDQIAATAAVSKPTVYRFFADKEQLFTEIVLGTLDQASQPFRTRLAALAETSQLTEELRPLARDYLATVIQPPVLQLRRLVIRGSMLTSTRCPAGSRTSATRSATWRTRPTPR